MPTPERQTELITQAAELTRQLAVVMAELGGQSDSLLDQYIDACLHRRAGHTVSFSEFFTRFKSWLPGHEQENWPKGRVHQELKFNVRNEGRADQPRKVIDGLSWQPAPPPTEQPKPETPEPTSPDYDVAMIRSVIKQLQADGVGNHDKIAAKLNELGHPDKYGNTWTGHNVGSVIWDYPY